MLKNQVKSIGTLVDMNGEIIVQMEVNIILTHLIMILKKSTMMQFIMPNMHGANGDVITGLA